MPEVIRRHQLSVLLSIPSLVLCIYCEPMYVPSNYFLSFKTNTTLSSFSLPLIVNSSPKTPKNLHSAALQRHVRMPCLISFWPPHLLFLQFQQMHGKKKTDTHRENEANVMHVTRYHSTPYIFFGGKYP